MDARQRWMYGDRRTSEYRAGLNVFLGAEADQAPPAPRWRPRGPGPARQWLGLAHAAVENIFKIQI